MRRRSRGSGLNPYVVLADVALTMLFILIFALMLQALAGSKAIRQMRREAEQRAVAGAVQTAFAPEIEERLVRLPTPDGNLQRISFADRVLFDSGDDRLK